MIEAWDDDQTTNDMNAVSTGAPAGGQIGALTPSVPSIDGLYRAHAKFVWHRLQQMGVEARDLEDALQEVFVVAFRHIPEFDPNRAKAKTWLSGISLNIARNFTRGEHRRESHVAHDAEPQSQPGTGNPEDSLERRQSQALLMQLLGSISIEHRTTFVLFELEKMSCAEIAEEMEVPLGTVHSRLHHARKHIAEAIETQTGVLRSKGAIAL